MTTLEKITAFSQRMTRISDYINDKKHLGTIANLSELMKG